MEPITYYRGKPRLSGVVSGFGDYDDRTLLRLKQVMSLYMSVSQLSLFCAQCRATNHTPDTEELYFLDSLVARCATRPDTHTLTRLSTADKSLANAFGELLEECRDANREKTPPMTLRAVADAIYTRLGRNAAPRPYAAQISNTLTLTEGSAGALLHREGKRIATILSTEDADPAIAELADHGRPHPDVRIVNGDTLCLLCGESTQPTAQDCRALRVLLTERDFADAVRQIRPVAPAQLLPETLRRHHGIVLSPASLMAQPDAPLSSLLHQTRGGWMLGVATDKLAALSALAAAYGLQLLPYATVNKTNRWSLDVQAGRDISYPGAFLAKLTLAQAYDIDLGRTPVPVDAVFERRTLCQHNDDACMQGTWYPAQATARIGNFRVCCGTLSLSEGLENDTIEQALSELLDALSQDQAATDTASAAVSLTLSDDLSPATLWMTLLSLYRALAARKMSVLPLVLQQSANAAKAHLTIYAIAPAKDTPTPDTTMEAESAASDSDVCSRVHVAAPVAILPRLAGAGDLMTPAQTLLAAGARVTIQPTDTTHDGCTALADAILGANILLLCGECEPWMTILTHRRVSYALEQFFEKDGLLLATGGAIEAFCRAGLGGEALTALHFAPHDARCVLLREQSDHAPMPFYQQASEEPQHALLCGSPANADEQTLHALSGQILSVLHDAPQSVCGLLARDSHALLCAHGVKKEQLLAAVRYFQ